MTYAYCYKLQMELVFRFDLSPSDYSLDLTEALKFHFLAIVKEAIVITAITAIAKCAITNSLDWITPFTDSDHFAISRYFGLKAAFKCKVELVTNYFDSYRWQKIVYLFLIIDPSLF